MWSRSNEWFDALTIICFYQPDREAFFIYEKNKVAWKLPHTHKWIKVKTSPGPSPIANISLLVNTYLSLFHYLAWQCIEGGTIYFIGYKVSSKATRFGKQCLVGLTLWGLLKCGLLKHEITTPEAILYTLTFNSLRMWTKDELAYLAKTTVYTGVYVDPRISRIELYKLNTQKRGEN